MTLDKLLIHILEIHWHKSVIKRASFGECSIDFPASLLQEHTDARIGISEEVANQEIFMEKKEKKEKKSFKEFKAKAKDALTPKFVKKRTLLKNV